MLITFFGFGMTFFVAGILLFLSVFPLLFLNANHEPFKFNLKDVSMVSKKRGMKLVAMGGNNAVERVFWPIFLFAVIGVYAKMGLVFFIAEIGAFAGAFWFGSYTNRKLMVKILKWGGFLCSLTWFARVAFEGVLILSILTILTAFLSEMVNVPFNTLTFDREVRRKYLSEYVVFRNLMFSIGWLVALGVVSIFENYISSFITSGIMYAIFLF